MLHISTHAGPAAEVSRFNRLDWLDIGYSRMDAVADYKIVMFKIGQGAVPPVVLKNYPRWSLPLWDLTARAIALALDEPEQGAAPRDYLPEHEPVEGRDPFAFAERLTCVINYRDPRGTQDTVLGSMELRQVQDRRGHYTAQLTEDLRPRMVAAEFVFKPKYLHPCELVARAALMALTGSINARLAAPTAPKVPDLKLIEGENHILIDELGEPRRTGFLRWLLRNRHPIVTLPDTSDGAARAALYSEFIRHAV